MLHPLKLVWRGARNRKYYTIINISGLVLGIICSLLIMLWVRDERGIDHLSKDGDRLFLLYESRLAGGIRDGGYTTPGILATTLKEEIPEIEYASGISWLKDTPDQVAYKIGDKTYTFNTCYADQDFFKMMPYPLLSGNKSDALASPKSICISQTMARSMFGSIEAAYGKMIDCSENGNLQVTGVFKDIPKNASAKFDCLINWSDYLAQNDWAKDWGNSGPNTLIMLHENANPLLVSKKIKHFLDKYRPPSAQYRVELGMQRFQDSYLQDKFVNGKLAGGRIQLVHLFTIIAIFILAIACINFINLATAQATQRAKEVGIRKVAGAGRLTLIRQFLTESIVLVMFSTLIALVATNLVLPYFNTFVGKQIHFPYLDSLFWLGLVLMAFLTAISAGIYPAILISAYNPVAVLKGSVKSDKATMFRKSLVIFQFTITIVMIVATVIVHQQLNYMQQTNIGYNKNNIIEIPLHGNLSDKYDIFKDKVQHLSGVRSVSQIGESPTNIGSITMGVSWPGKGADRVTTFTQSIIDYDFVKTMGMHLVAGSDYSKQMALDTTGYLINESAQRLIGYKDPVGKPLTFWDKTGPIIGVVKDFHFASLQDPIKPLILHWRAQKPWGNMLIRVNNGMTDQVLHALEAVAKEVNPGQTFTYSFVDDDYNKLYIDEQMLGKISSCFSFLAIFISCLGLLGLVLHSVSRRKKEIGIRKILGARVMPLIVLLSKEFVQHVMIAFLIAAPVSWWLLNGWLKQYAYKISISWWVFALAGMLAMIIAIITVGFQAFKTARANPVAALKTE